MSEFYLNGSRPCSNSTNGCYVKTDILDCDKALSWNQPSISSKFYVQIFRTNVVFYVHVTKEKLPKWHLYKKRAHIMLMKLTPGVNFIILQIQMPNAQKRQSSKQCCFALLVPTSLKALGKMLMKSTPRGQCHQPFGAKRKCASGHYLVPFSFNNKFIP